MIQLLAFDLDGTLFETSQGIANAFNALMREKGLPPVEKSVITSFIGTGLRDLLSKLEDYYEKHSSQSVDVAKIRAEMGDLPRLEAEFRQHYNQNFLEESFLYPGVLDFLNSWQHKVAIVSNKTEYYVRELINQTELRKFDWVRIIGGNSLPQKKPHPLPLQEVIQQAGVTPGETLMIGDGLPDMWVARNAQVKPVAVSFGYTPLSELIQNGAHAYIHKYDELPKVITDLGTN
jgi:phosphoglycolate phosphatase